MDTAALCERGFCIVPDVLDTSTRARLVQTFEGLEEGRAGSRTALAHPAVRELVGSPAMRALVQPVLGRGAFAVRATWFDKTPAANWLVAWHQDLVIAVRERRKIEGYGPWSTKEGVPHVQAPAAVLEDMLAVRFDLDGSHDTNGALCVLPGTHRHGVLDAARRAELAATAVPMTCAVPAGGALVLRPLLLHASSRAVAASHRRVLHVELAARELDAGLAWYDRVEIVDGVRASQTRDGS